MGKDGLDNFMRHPSYMEYAAVVAESNSVKITDLKNTTRGRNGATYLHPDMAVVFARWISPAFAYWCDKQVSALIQKAQAAPILAANARTKKLQKLGRPDEVIALRHEGVNTRQAFTSRLQQHGVNQFGFSGCTRAIYTPMFGGSTKLIKQKLNVPDNGNVRDYMSVLQLSSLLFAEALAGERIKKEGTYGNLACEQVCNQVGQSVAKMIVDTRRGLAA
jgi:hypothetical protein